MSKHKLPSFAALLGACLALLAPAAQAEDIDIFVGRPGAVAAPNVIILLDSTNDWCSDQPTGTSKITALKNVINGIAPDKPVNVGLAMWAEQISNDGGAYIRYGVRDMSVAANRTAFNAMLDRIADCTRKTQETGRQKDEAGGLYEIWRYFRSLTPKIGFKQTAGSNRNLFVDAANNDVATKYSGSDVITGSTTHLQGLTTGFAYTGTGGSTSTYNGPTADCSKNYIVYISARNGTPNSGAGSQTYTGAGSDAGVTYNAGLPSAVANVTGQLTGSADDWARFLQNPQQAGWPRITSYVIDAYDPTQSSSADYPLLMQNIARQGGGTYKAATSGAEIQAELQRIFAEIQAVNNAFASAALPVNATSRSQNENQVFIGTFRPDEDAKPRWFGNMKQYQLIVNATGGIVLGDANKLEAIDPATGFFKSCATSFFTSDSGTYWQDSGTFPPPAGLCTDTTFGTFDKYSDRSDGPFVEKGGVGEVIRKGNNPPYPVTAGIGAGITTNAVTNALNRTIYTLASPVTSALATFGNTTLGAGAPEVLVSRFTRGEDVNLEVSSRAAADPQLTRPSLHGDVVHSRALPVNYGGTVGTVVYYGANDGTLRAVEVCKGNVRVKDIDVTKPKDESCVTPSGKEKWAFVAPEHFPKLKRLKDQGPFVKYPNVANPLSTVTFAATNTVVTWTAHGLSAGSTVSFTTTGTLPTQLAPDTQYFLVNVTANTFRVSLTSGGTAIGTSASAGSGTHTATSPATSPKGYFFDGGIGSFQNLDNSKVWIFPSMRRGGRMIYALDVTNSATPVFKWKVGCPNATDDTGCVASGGASGTAPATSTAFSGIGQTWSLPSVAFVKGYSTTTPVVVFGGGYDTCEDSDAATTTCSSPKGAAVYVVNADTGALIRTFTATGMRSVAADVAFVDTNGDNMVDHAYVVDTGGSFYRIDFVNSAKTEITDPNNWTMTKIAGTTGSARKFLFPPALLFNNDQVFLSIGSGDRERPLVTNYPYTTPVVNRFYVFVDDPRLPKRPPDLPPATYTPVNLDNSPSEMMNKTTDGGCSATPVTPGATVKGWFMDLTANGTGEQTVGSAVVIGGLVTFSTNRPIPTPVGTCSTLLGQARGYFLNLLNGSGAIGVSGSCGGSRSDTFVGGGLPPSPVTATIIVDDVPRTVVIGAIQRSGDPSSAVEAQELKPPIVPIRKRIYWYTPGTDS